MMLITFTSGAELRTNNQKDLDNMFELGHEPLSIKFVPGETRIEPEPEDKRIVITFKYMMEQVKETRKIGQAKLNAIRI